MRGDTIRDVRKRLAATFPEIAFTYGMAGTGRKRGPSVRWTGGPPAETVRQAAAWWPSWRNPRPLHLHREMTEAEREAWLAEQDREHAEWVAAAPAREAARKAATAEARRLGAIKAKETRALRAEQAAVVAALQERWPDACGSGWAWVGERLWWRDGPTEAEVRASGIVPAIMLR